MAELQPRIDRDTFRRWLTVVMEKGGKLHVNRVALREAIGATTDFQGIIGTLTCDEFGDCGTGRVNIYYHVNSGTTNVAQLPVEYQFAP